jgi:polysaccharide export outer membrane protein
MKRILAAARIALLAGAAFGACALGLVCGHGGAEVGRGRPVASVSTRESRVVDWDRVKLCQALGPAAPYPIWGVDSTAACGQGEVTWKARGPVDWQAFAQGEYAGHARLAHVPDYRLRVDDEIAFVYRLTHEATHAPYQLQVGDTIRVESLTGDASEGGAQDNIRRDIEIQPDGTISLPLLGQVRAADMTIESLRQQLEERYKRYYKVPAITVTPVKINTRLQDLLNAVYARRANNAGGLPQSKINPDGRVYLPGLDPICAQGLTIAELKWEVDSRYAASIPGVDVTPIIISRAPRNVFVIGEVKTPGRYTLEGPTTLIGALSMAGGWNRGANLRQIVVFRRGDDWRMLATMLDVNGALYGRRPTPADDIWLNDSDIIIVPKSPILVADEFISQFFTEGVYAMFPQFAFGAFNFNNFRSISQ